MTIKKTKLRLYEDSDWEKVKFFIHKNWRENHPICKKELFDWQHKGFGNENGKLSSLVLLSNEEVVGFRGVIPGLYQVPFANNQMKVIKGGASPMWLVRKDFRGMVSFKMYLKTLQMLPATTAVGFNANTALKFHLRNQFSVLNAIHRYVIPLNSLNYQKILSRDVEISPIEEWVSIRKGSNQAVKPGNPDLNLISEIWEKTTFPQKIFSLFRNADFWKWRYIESTGFKYLFFGDPEKTGVIVARIEKIVSAKKTGLDGQKIFRIIEVIPRSSLAWERKVDKVFTEMIHGVLNWAVDQNCLMADFQCSSTRFDPILTAIGFREQNRFMDEPIFSIPVLFNPINYDFSPINVAFRVDQSVKGHMDIDWNDTYIVKSESDQDRPNN